MFTCGHVHYIVIGGHAHSNRGNAGMYTECTYEPTYKMVRKCREENVLILVLFIVVGLHVALE